MLINWIQRILFFFLLIFVQICILNKIHLFGFVTPLLYVYFILKLPTNTSRNEVLFWSFSMGLVLDIFSYSMGLNMIAATSIGFIRYYILRMHTSREVTETFSPSIRTMGGGAFIRYAIWMILLHHAILFSVDTGSLYDFKMLALRIVGSAASTLILVIGCEALNIKGH